MYIYMAHRILLGVKLRTCWNNIYIYIHISTCRYLWIMKPKESSVFPYIFSSLQQFPFPMLYGWTSPCDVTDFSSFRGSELGSFSQ